VRIEDYGLLSDLETAALVGADGSIDWLCLPRFDSPSCFAALLGDADHGRWLLGPAGETRRASRRYRDGTLVLETEFETEDGVARLIDCMPPRQGAISVVRVVEGLRGRVTMRMELIIRLDYGSAVPWVTSAGDGLTAVQGPDALQLVTPVEVRGERLTSLSTFELAEGERVPFVLQWHPSHEPAPKPPDAERAVSECEQFWRKWSAASTYEGEWGEAVGTSLAVLKGLTHSTTGGIVAAPTTSLPEALGGERNWDYRYCWVRDAALSLYALLLCGHGEEALAFRDWLMRAVAGSPAQARIMYGVAGERRLSEELLEHLPGYERSAPVRIGNAAADQFQMDIYGELLNVGYFAHLTGRARGLPPDLVIDPAGWDLQLAVLRFLESAWDRADQGIWEVRGPPRAFTYSRVMAWVALDRAVRTVEEFGMDGPLDRWKRLRAEIHEEVCRKAYDPERRTFTQYYGSTELDATGLLIPAVGFLPPGDPRVVGTVEAIQRELSEDGLTYRYTGDSTGTVDGLAGKEGAFVPCSFWLADALAMIGRRDEARDLFERLLGLRNELGLLSEEYDPVAGRMLGNFPQAFSHLALINTAHVLGERGRSIRSPEAADGAAP
jgi:GH15 family glucan-1,4-alpha-glucosidase